MRRRLGLGALLKPGELVLRGHILGDAGLSAGAHGATGSEHICVLLRLQLKMKKEGPLSGSVSDT